MSKFVVQVAHGSQVAAPSLATSLQPRRACLCSLIHGSGHNMLWANKHSCRSAIFPTPRCSCVARPRAEPGSGRPRSHAANGLLAAAICSEKRGRSLESCPHCLHTAHWVSSTEPMCPCCTCVSTTALLLRQGSLDQQQKLAAVEGKHAGMAGSSSTMN